MGPPVKHKVIAMRKTKEALGPTVHVIALGIVMRASCSSSDMCTEQSYAMRAVRGVVSPIMAPMPVVGQATLFGKSKITPEGARGARPHW